MRILSLLPAATEMVCLLGLQKDLVGVTDDCDFPPEVKKIPKVTECLADQFLSSSEIDQKVKDLGHMGMSIAHLDEKKLAELRPDLILTQDLCKVCAVSYSQVKKAARILESRIKNKELRIISLEPESIGDIFENIRVIGEISGRSEAAKNMILSFRSRMTKMDSRLRGNDKRPKVLVIEWLEPLMVAGHWVPEMVEKAGGEMLLTKPGEKSRYISVEEIIKSKPDIVVFSPCGFDIKRTLKEEVLVDELIENSKLKIPNSKSFLVDGNAYLTRHGPRIIDGVEIFSEIFHPEIFKRSHPKSDWIEYT